MMEKELIYQIIDASVSATKIGIDIGRQQFAADLKERIIIKSISPGIATLSPIIELKEVFKLIDETLNAK